MRDLNSTPSANRLHIGIFGRRNTGKSSLINTLTNQNAALVSEFAGTTTDPVYKAMEVRGLGPCVFIDTAGFDDTGELGELRIQKTKETLSKTEIAILIFSDENQTDFSLELSWYQELSNMKIPVLPVITKTDLFEATALKERIQSQFSIEPVLLDNIHKSGVEELLSVLTRMLPENYAVESITASLVEKEDIVMLVMPQDSEAPKGRLILPQVQTIRDLLDHKCAVICTTPETMQTALNSLKESPSLIITDSQAFHEVAKMKPENSRLTSFSILFAAYKGDLNEFVLSANALDHLTSKSRVLIAEACTHAPLTEDIGRVKIPAMLRKRFGSDLQIDIVSGTNFPNDLSPYDLIVHCGGCMFNRKYLLSRIDQAKKAGVPITNYGVLLAKCNGILEQVVLPE